MGASLLAVAKSIYYSVLWEHLWIKEPVNNKQLLPFSEEQVRRRLIEHDHNREYHNYIVKYKQWAGWPALFMSWWHSY